MKTLAADNLASGSSSQHSWIVSTSVLSPWERGSGKKGEEEEEEEGGGEEGGVGEERRVM